MTAINIKAQSCNNNDCIKNEKKNDKNDYIKNKNIIGHNSVFRYNCCN
jgi:hypothetical protein